MKFTAIEMDWTDDGARCLSTMEGVACPRCGESLIPNQEHRCGDRKRSPRKKVVPVEQERSER